MLPWSSMASLVYCEQEGSNRHCRPTNILSVYWYRVINFIKKIFSMCSTILAYSRSESFLSVFIRRSFQRASILVEIVRLGRPSKPLRIKTITSNCGSCDLVFLKDSLIKRFILFRSTDFGMFFLLTTMPNLVWHFLCLIASMRMKRQETLCSALSKTPL